MSEPVSGHALNLTYCRRALRGHCYYIGMYGTCAAYHRFVACAGATVSSFAFAKSFGRPSRARRRHRHRGRAPEGGGAGRAVRYLAVHKGMTTRAVAALAQ
eukprot:1976023-Pleurochrysis_carterae.AAC.1